ncbi:hypothetical protein RA307_03765 [Xanthobacteraceae bacterium Astr-EGSB]|uniref:hypothetical protein n=1 Tax=Astrobacterium formosum TaxID=3069710 RepID=UPI0027B6074D|nr:hypothetical protein [Xanthobacteraceae bacterium Astr-EGSB]
MTMRSILVRTAAAAAMGLLAGTAFAEPVFPTGSHIGLDPPGAMQPSSLVRGFEDRDASAVILIGEIPAAAYANVEKSMTAAALSKQGFVEEKREKFTLPDGNGVLISGHQEADGKTLRKWLLLAAMPKLTTLIAVQAPDADKAYNDASIRAALATVKARESVPVDELMRLVPVVFENLSGMRPIRVAPPGGVLLTDGPKDTMEATEQPVLAVSLGVGAPEKASDRDHFARNLLGGMSELKDARLVSRDLIKLGTMQTHEIQAEGQDAKSGVPMRLVQWVRFAPGGYIRLVGISTTERWREAFPRFRGVRDGIKPR